MGDRKFDLILSMRGNIMKRMITLSLLLFIFIGPAISSAQPHLANNSPVLEVPQGFILESLCGYGYNNTTINTVSNLRNTNPVNMFEYNRIAFGISYQAESKIKESWIANIHHYRKNLALPQSFSWILPLNKIRLGLGFDQKYNSEKDYGDVTITVVDTSNPAGYLEIGTVQFFKTCFLFDYSIFLAYTFKNLITNNDAFDLGFKICLYRLFNELNSKVINMLAEY
jgi:hypothetical protein